MRLLETLYFSSLKTDERRPCVCTVNYVDPQQDREADHADGWTTIRFHQPIPLSVHSLTKLAEATDPAVSSLAVFCDGNGSLYIWGMVDQELRYGDHVALDAKSDRTRPGLFQVTITGVGNLSVFKNYGLLGSLEQNSLVAAYHDVLWEGPVYERLKDNLNSTLDDIAASTYTGSFANVAKVKSELLVRWQNTVCRLLLNIQQYGHGGGLLIVPRCSANHVSVKYPVRYDRLPKALFGLAQHQFLKRQAADSIDQHCRTPNDVLPCNMHFDAVDHQRKLDEHKNEALGCVRFIASLSRVDGFVLLDKNLVVNGFGVEARSDCDATDVYIATDANATPRMLRQATLNEFGTRHRAMMRYCREHADALGFVISQDGDIRATMTVKDRLILWENINVQLGFRTEHREAEISDIEPLTDLFRFWSESLTSLRSA